MAEGGDGLSTIAQIITKYAPAADGNDTGSYIAQVAAAAGVKDPNQPVDLVNDKALWAKVMSAMIQREGSMPGNVPTPDDLMANLPQLQQQARDAAAAQFPDQPDAGDLAASKVYSQVLQTKNAFDTQQKGARDTVLGAVDSNRLTDPSQILQLGGPTATAWLALTPESQQSVLAFMHKNFPGADDLWTPQKQQTFEGLSGMIATNPAGFEAMNIYDPKLVDSMTSKQYGLIKDQRDAMQKGATTGGIAPEKINGALNYLAPMLATAGIDKKKAPQSYQQFAGAFALDVQDYANQHNGKMPGAQDQQNIAQRLLQQGTVNGTGWFGFGSKSEPLYKAEDQFRTDPATGKTLFSEGKSDMDPNWSVSDPAFQKALPQINAAYQKLNGGKLPPPKVAQAIYLQNYDQYGQGNNS